MAEAVATLSTSEVGARLRPAWPLYVLLLGFPLWWVLGLGAFIWPVLAVPMLFSLIMRERVTVPRGFGIWVLFLLWMLASATQLDEPQRGIIFIYRAAVYFSATVLFLYVYNASSESLPAGRVLMLLAAFWMIAVTGGFLGILFSDVSFRTPVEMLMPRGLLSNSFVYELVHPRFAQVQEFLGYPVPRPTAPFVYTNEWGSNMALLTPLALAAWVHTRNAFRKTLIRVMLVASVIPIVVSLNRGLWLSLSLGLVYASFRLAAQGRGRALGAMLAGLAIVATLVLTTPLKDLVSERLATPHSNEGRLALYQEAAEGILESPLVGFGAPRPSERNPNAPRVGTHGQLWLVLFSHGIPAAALFIGWFLYAFWRTREARSGIRFWTNVALLIALVQMPYYGLVPVPLHILMIAAALAFREAREDRPEATPGSPRLASRRAYLPSGASRP
jgi:polysaccharide biosynthesis protein PslJ